MDSDTEVDVEPVPNAQVEVLQHREIEWTSLLDKAVKALPMMRWHDNSCHTHALIFSILCASRFQVSQNYFVKHLGQYLTNEVGETFRLINAIPVKADAKELTEKEQKDTAERLEEISNTLLDRVWNWGGRRKVFPFNTMADPGGILWPLFGKPETWDDVSRALIATTFIDVEMCVGTGDGHGCGKKQG